MAILVTGGAGFVGLNVVQALLDYGDDVVLFDAGDLPPGALRMLGRYGKRLTMERGNVLELQPLDAIFKKHGIELVVHAAAVTSGPGREAREPATIIDVNLRGTINLLETARKHAVQRVLYVGSGAAYGESLYRLPRLYEQTPSVPTTLYSITKHAAERICIRLKELWKLDLMCVRLGTVIGPWERDTGVRDNFGTHSQLAAMAVAGKRATLTPREVQRDWVYARDVAAAMTALLHGPRPAHVLYNLSSGLRWEQPIAVWCEMLKLAYPRFSYCIAQCEEEATIWYTDRDRGLMDTGRIAMDIGFQARYPMRGAYADYLEWMERTPEFFQA